MAEWVHDLGGADGHGAVDIEPDEPTFHADWERRMFGMTATVMTQGRVNGSEFRHAIERMDRDWYLGSSYYEHWLTALATLLVEKGDVAREELEAHGAGAPAVREGRRRGGGAGGARGAGVPARAPGRRGRAATRGRRGAIRDR